MLFFLSFSKINFEILRFNVKIFLGVLMIYFIRHGETEYNKDARFQGHLDIPLNKVGVLQAQTALEKSKQLNFDKIYCSPLSRARQTAEIINTHHNVKLIEDDRLKEIYMGSLQGRMFKDLSDEEKRLAFSTPEYFGGETHEQLCSRVISFFKEIENSTENILIVSHGGIYRALYKYLNNLDSLEFNLKPIPNAEIVLLKH